MVMRKDVRQIRPYVYEIARNFRHDMRVPARFYADETILQQALGDDCLDQLINTATLPGIVGHALAMPDIHQGYGFPIGGVVATTGADGVISPGGVGFDINCLAGDSLVLDAWGYTRPIAEYETDWPTQTLRCHALQANREAQTPVAHFLRQTPRALVLRATTASGRTLVATADHPVWTPEGMVELGALAEGDRVAVVGFDGVPYEEPSDDVILTQADLENTLARLGKGAEGNAVGQIMRHLDSLGLLPLRYSSPALPPLLRVMGIVWGDGTMHISSSGKGVTACYGRVEDLEDLRQDIQAIGFTPSRVYARSRHHRFQTTYGISEFDFVETWIKVSSTALVTLLVALGVPLGRKVQSDWRLPAWIKAAPRWQKRLFLAAHFGAEMNAPGTVSQHDYNFETPILSLNKRTAYVESGAAWLQDIADLLTEFGVETLPIGRRVEYTNAQGEVSIRLRLPVVAMPANLIRFWSQVGFECHRHKRSLASVAVIYLRRKQAVLAARAATARAAVAMQAAGESASAIKAALVGAHANERFIERSLWEERETDPRIGLAFMPFASFAHQATAGLGQSGMVWDEVVRIEPRPDFSGDVYDFTVAHEDHNFVANGFVVSNCGVRLLASHLDRQTVQPHLSALATELYKQVPSGAGEKGFVSLSVKELDEVLAQGSQWALKKGFARADDLEHTEERA